MEENKMILKDLGSKEEFFGNVGIKANFTDSNGDNLYVGDVVKIEDSNELSIVCGNTSNDRFDIMGLWGEHVFNEKSIYRIYKEKSYKSMNNGDKIRHITYCSEESKEMTISEIEKELGYSIKIIKEN